MREPKAIKVNEVCVILERGDHGDYLVGIYTDEAAARTDYYYGSDKPEGLSNEEFLTLPVFEVVGRRG